MNEVAEASVEAKDAPSTIVSSECEERQRNPDLAVEEAIRRRIKDDGTYAFYFREVACECSTGVLKVRGRVPTDRLKNVLWSLIRDLDGLTGIDDQLDVVSSTGLSSVRPRRVLIRCNGAPEEERKVTMVTDNEARLKSIVRTAVDGIVTIDERGIVDTFNAAAQRLFGYRAEEVIGKNVKMLMPAPYRDQHDEFLAQYLATREKKIIGIGREVVGRRKDGLTFPVHLSVGEMLLGDQRFFTGILHDISDRKQAEERALQAERLAAIGQMIGVVTHESRNAFQRMQANLEMLAIEVEDRPDATDYISRIQGAQDGLHHFFEELRSYATPTVLDCERCRIDHLVGQVLNEVSALHKRRQIRLHPHINGCDSRCEVDPFRMSQVFRNMVENSLAACPDPLTIDLVLSDSQLDGRQAVDLVYRDNGPGLAEDHRERVFEPFFTTKTKGTGLGMAIAKRIVEAHGGRIAVGNNGSVGAEFAITLPRQSA